MRTGGGRLRIYTLGPLLSAAQTVLPGSRGGMEYGLANLNVVFTQLARLLLEWRIFGVWRELAHSPYGVKDYFSYL
jgi:hypothetical protein